MRRLGTRSPRSAQVATLETRRAKDYRVRPEQLRDEWRDVARRLGVSRSWVYDAAASGRIPCVRLGGPDGPLRFVPGDVEAWLDEARRNWLPGGSRSVPRPSSSSTTQLRLLGEP
jgi:excisionase family DNA binding protein